MNIELLASGTKPPRWISEGFHEYQKRLPRDWSLTLNELPVARRHKGESIEKLKRDEGKRMLAALKRGWRVVALDVTGTMWSTGQLATRLEAWRAEVPGLQLLIGGPDGLAPGCLEAADETWSLSRLTFPHFMVRVVLAEQLYRAWAVLNHHPYHK